MEYLKKKEKEQQIMKYLFMLLLAYALTEFPGRYVIQLENTWNGTNTLAYQVAVNLMVTGWIFGVYACIMLVRTCEQGLIKRHKAVGNRAKYDWIWNGFGREVKNRMDFMLRIKAAILAFLSNTKAAVDPVAIVVFVVALFVAGILLPTALTGFQAANYTANDSTVRTIAVLLVPVLALIGLGLMFLQHVRRSA